MFYDVTLSTYFRNVNSNSKQICTYNGHYGGLYEPLIILHVCLKTTLIISEHTGYEQGEKISGMTTCIIQVINCMLLKKYPKKYL